MSRRQRLGLVIFVWTMALFVRVEQFNMWGAMFFVLASTAALYLLLGDA